MRSNGWCAAADFRRGPGRRRGPVLHSDVAQLFMRDMKDSAPPQLPIFRSRLQGELLARLFLGPDREMTMLDLAVMLRTDLGSVVREVDRLARAGLLVLRRTTAGRMVRRDTATPLYEPLARLLMLTFGPKAVIAEEFARLPGVVEVLIFGAWAERYEGVGDSAGDVEVLVIGELSHARAFDAAQEAAARLGLPVHAVVRSARCWQEDDDPFLREIRAGSLCPISS